MEAVFLRFHLVSKLWLLWTHRVLERKPHQIVVLLHRGVLRVSDWCGQAFLNDLLSSSGVNPRNDFICVLVCNHRLVTFYV